MNVSAFFRLMRPKQWTKNLFVLAPLIFSFKMTNADFVIQAGLAATLFCLIASTIYIVNDWRDVQSDQKHPKKCKRPLASGEVSKRQAACLLILLLALAAGTFFYAAFTSSFFISLGIYITLSLGYSFGLKHVSLVELFVVASGYVLRLLAGCAAINEVASPWILAATGGVALLIVAGKRRAEIAENNDPDQMRKSLRDYNLTFLDSMITMLAAVTFVTYLLFTTSDYAISRFHAPYFVATSVFVLFGVLRYMQLVKVMAGADDPTTLVLTDKNLRYTVLGWLATCIGMIYFR